MAQAVATMAVQETSPARRREAQEETSSPAEPTQRGMSIRQELSLYIGILFAGGLLVAVLAFVVALPLLHSLWERVLFLSLIVAADFVIVFLFVRYLVNRVVQKPVETLAISAERIAGGDLDHRAEAAESEEFQRLSSSINRMTERLVRDQRKLEENIRSLDETNQELVDTTEELVHAARMASVGTLAAGIAHEVGNPLGAIMNYLDLARSRARNGKDPDEVLGAARDEAGRIDRIVRSLLEYARPKEETPEPTEVELHQVVERTAHLLDAQGAFDGIELDREGLSEDIPPVGAHPQHLEQVLVNLLLNAADSVREAGGRRILLVARVEEGPSEPPVRRRRKDDPPGADYSHRRRWSQITEGGAQRGVRPWTGRSVVLLVEDEGTGIPEDDLRRIFDPFYSTKVPGRGTGLGLALSARLTENMGGTLEAENREEGGARFRLSLPQDAHVRTAI